MHTFFLRFITTLVAVFFVMIATMADATETIQRQAHEFYARGDLPAAITLLQEAIAEHALDPQLHFMLANAYFRLQQWDKAVEQYDQAARLRPRHPDTYLGLGYAHHRAGRMEMATAAWQMALGQSPNDALMHLSLAIGLNGQGQATEARQHVARAIDVDSSWHHRLSIDMRWTPEMVREIIDLVDQLEDDAYIHQLGES